MAVVNGRRRSGWAGGLKLRGAALETLLRVLREAVDEHGQHAIARWSNIPERTIYRLLNESPQFVSLAVADDLITAIDVALWHTEPELQRALDASES